ncbi:unnamed protein product [Allacma fusca]|uniref:Uncharacterized protein n=1 Tax=Allacma fusca TaxID=39272 RepID=A0A8J2PYL4_9HEXA|nr:unnamed protein product [Allacma fusca]
MIIHLWLESIYQFYKVFTLFNDPEFSFDAYLKLLSHAISRLTALIVQTSTTLRARDYLFFYNQIFDLNNRFKSMCAAEGVADGCYKILWVYFTFVYVHPISVAFNYYNDNMNERYWQSILRRTKYYPYTIPFFAAGEFILSVFSNMILIPGYVIVLHMYSSRTWLKFLKTHKAQLDAGGSRKVEILYRTMQLHNKTFNDLCAVLWSFGLFGILFNSVLANVCTVRFVHVLPFPSNMMFIVGASTFLFGDVTIFTAAGEVVETSLEFLRCMSVTTDREQMMFSRSCGRLRIEARPFFYHQKCTIITFMRLVMDQTISVLVLDA